MKRSLRSTVSAPVRRGLERAGWELTRAGQRPDAFAIPPDCDPQTAAIVERVKSYTLTPPARVMALCESIRYLEHAGIDGPVLECGVWRGGSMMAAALTLLELGSTERELWMFDTFTEMPLPDDRDRHMSGKGGPEFFDEVVAGEEIYDLLPLERVRELIESTGYPAEKLRFVQGLVEGTIPAQAPERIALLRLDTDWYRSTIHEMQHLYGRIEGGGILIVDDYGEFAGARQAVDEHLAADGRPVLLNRVDFSCRLVQVPPR